MSGYPDGPTTPPSPRVQRRALRFAAVCTTLLLTLALAACGITPEAEKTEPLVVPEPLRAPKAEPTQEDVESEVVASDDGEPRTETAFSVHEAPAVSGSVGTDRLKDLSVDLDGDDVNVNFDNMPIPAFINTVFGDILDLSFEMHPGVREEESVVTLRASERQEPAQLFRMAVQVLDNYGVRVLRDGDLLRFVPTAETEDGEIPLLLTGRSLPDVPSSHRPVFQFVPLNTVRNADIRRWLADLFGDRGLKVDDYSKRNALVLQGTPQIVEIALEAIELLDRPSMRSRYSLRIDPAYREAQGLANDLTSMLEAEGYSVSNSPPNGAIFLIPLESTNSVVAFAGSRAILDRIRTWAEELDRPDGDPEQDGVFIYEVQNTRADNIVSVVRDVLGEGGGPATSDDGEDDGNSNRGGGSQQLVLDETRNQILFRGSGEQWQRLRPIIKSMDQASRLALVEVTIAEVTLSDEFDLGIEFALERSGLDATNELSTQGNLGLGSGGLNFTSLSDSGRTQAVLNAFATSDRVSILSTPRLMVRSGESASINVGTEVPFVTSRSTSSDLVEDGDSSILQNIEFRQTGVRLELEPVIHASNRIDLDVNQEVSEAQPNNTSSIDSPQIFDRSIETSLSLRDGGSVMLGGLITNSTNSGTTKVPGLGDIPLVGRLFRREEENNERTELIVIVVPYILDDYEDAESITDAFRERLEIETGETAPLNADEADGD